MVVLERERCARGPPAGQPLVGGSGRIAGRGLVPAGGLGPSANELLSLVGDGIISTDGEGTIILFNQAAEEMFGYGSDEVLGEPVEMLLPSSHRESHRKAVLGFGSQNSEAHRFMGSRREVVGRRKSGAEFPAEANLSRRTIRGQTVLTVAVRDISERKSIEEERQLVAAELAHRFKNCLAVVNSVVSLSARETDSVEIFRDALQGRLGAIAAAQDVLFEDRAKGAALRQLLAAELEPYVKDQDLEVSLAGPEVTVPPRRALRLTLAVHELATNAAKYGALSRPGGSLTIGWRSREERGGPVLVLDWKEAGGPPMRHPDRRGFGSTLIERCLGSSNVRLAFGRSGLEAELRLPLA